MPLIAQQTSTGDRIDITEFLNRNDVLLKYDRDDIQCPYCQGRMHLVAPNGRLMFWRHNVQCGSDVARSPESAQHNAAKRSIVTYLRGQAHESVEVFLEYHLPYVGEHGRIADVAMRYPTGHVVVYEIQLSQISVEELAARSADYQRAGIDDHWLFGGRAACSQRLLDWAIENFAYAGVIDIAEVSNHETIPLP